ncbi:MAG: argininosuccinate lyase, partial [Nocardioidaceae bacterium]
MTEQLWGGRFRAPTDPALLRLSRSPDAYFALARYDLAGSRSHARELHRAGLLDDPELDQMLCGLDRLETDVVAGDARPEQRDEDVHTFLERELIALLGP